MLWTIVVLNLAERRDRAVSLGELFWLTAVPNLVGVALRIPYTFAVPALRRAAVDGDQRLAAADPVHAARGRRPERVARRPRRTTRSSGSCSRCAATAGFGGGNFSSSMANISFFYPEGRKGLALGLNAAGGNLGVASPSCSSRS